MKTRKPKQSKPIKMHGGKHYLKNIIRQLAAPHRVRVYGCAGGWAEGWDWVDDCQKVAEIVNDVDGWLINFYEVLADERLSQKLIRKLRVMPFSEEQWRRSSQIVKTWGSPRTRSADDQVLAAFHFFIHMRLSMSGRGDSFAPFSFCRLRNQMLEQASALFGAVEGLPEASVRLRYVGIRNLPVAKLIPTVDKPGTWIYLDPPYHPDTRVSKNVYRHEMPHEDHEVMLDELGKLKHAKFLLSGYDCTLYRKKKKQYGFRSVSVGRPNASAKGEEKETKTEVFWSNYDLPRLQIK